MADKRAGRTSIDEPALTELLESLKAQAEIRSLVERLAKERGLNPLDVAVMLVVQAMRKT